MKVLLLDDHPLINSANEELLKAAIPGAQISAMTSFKEVEQQRGEFFDLIVSDLVVPGIEPQALIDYYKATFTQARLVFFSSLNANDPVALQITQAGDLFVSKAGSYKDIVSKLHAYLGLKDSLDLTPSNEFRSTVQVAGCKPLTLKQAAAMDLIVQGRTTKEIARELGISPDTVRAHVKEAYVRLGNSVNRAQAVSVYLQAKKVSMAMQNA